MLDEINVHENPALADLGTRYFSEARFIPQRHGMEAQQFSGFLQVKCSHGYQEQAQPAIFLDSSQTNPTFPARCCN